MQYQFPQDRELLQKEKEQFSEFFSINRNGSRIYHSVNLAEKAYIQIQIQEMRRYAKVSGIILDEIKNEETINTICFEWITQYASKFAEFWQKTHKKISNNKT